MSKIKKKVLSFSIFQILFLSDLVLSELYAGSTPQSAVVGKPWNPKGIRTQDPSATQLRLRTLNQGSALGSQSHGIPVPIPTWSNFWDWDWDWDSYFLNLGLGLGLGFIFSEPGIGIGIPLPTPALNYLGPNCIM